MSQSSCKRLRTECIPLPTSGPWEKLYRSYLDLSVGGPYLRFYKRKSVIEGEAMATISHCDNTLAGANVSEIWRSDGEVVISSLYTYVYPKWRRQGIAKKIWHELLTTVRPTVVEIVAVTDRGFTMATAVREVAAKVDPAIQVVVSENAYRPLRVLK